MFQMKRKRSQIKTSSSSSSSLRELPSGSSSSSSSLLTSTKKLKLTVPEYIPLWRLISLLMNQNQENHRNVSKLIIDYAYQSFYFCDKKDLNIISCEKEIEKKLDIDETIPLMEELKIMSLTFKYLEQKGLKESQIDNTFIICDDKKPCLLEFNSFHSPATINKYLLPLENKIEFKFRYGDMFFFFSKTCLKIASFSPHNEKWLKVNVPENFTSYLYDKEFENQIVKEDSKFFETWVFAEKEDGEEDAKIFVYFKLDLTTYTVTDYIIEHMDHMNNYFVSDLKQPYSILKVDQKQPFLIDEKKLCIKLSSSLILSYFCFQMEWSQYRPILFCEMKNMNIDIEENKFDECKKICKLFSVVLFETNHSSHYDNFQVLFNEIFLIQYEQTQKYDVYYYSIKTNESCVTKAVFLKTIDLSSSSSSFYFHPISSENIVVSTTNNQYFLPSNSILVNQ